MKTPSEGWHGADDAPQQGEATWQAKVGAAASLSDLLEEYVLFTHAPLFCFAEFDRDPLHDFFLSQGGRMRVAHIDFPDPVFDGLVCRGDPGWNHRLLIVDKASWPALDVFLLHASGINRDLRKFYRVFSQKIPVPDVLALAKASVLPVTCPTVDVYTYSVTGLRRLVGFEPALNPPFDRPRVVFHPPEPEIVALARSFLGEADSPFRAALEPNE